jgi:hypothetical protein
MSLGVYFSLWHKLLVVAVAAPCRSHSYIHGGMPCPLCIFSPLWHKLLVVVAALHRDPILIYMEECHGCIFLPCGTSW